MHRLPNSHRHENRQRNRRHPAGLRRLHMVLEDVTEFEITPEGRRITKLDQILLNGNNITMLIPGGEGPEV
uniref:LSM5 homolog, U6 small nuclear RNA and mRNA degradation associated n=1 Tax=Gasterosteus aculeatus aculeatus TaxID=481459 RepID=A0AAQ4QXM3_GASAC